jgi:microsomal dipeptidase-like Zn-dependent dipeptidase
MIRSFVYDALILRLTSRWYAEVLRRVPDGATLLDVGIGTAGALLANADMVQRKGIRITGIDIDGDYIERARQRLRDSSLSGYAVVRHESVCDHRGGPYDAVTSRFGVMFFADPVRARRQQGISAPGEAEDVFNYVPDLNTPRRMEQIADALAARGYSSARIEKILGQNWLRLFGDVWT